MSEPRSGLESASDRTIALCADAAAERIGAEAARAPRRACRVDVEADPESADDETAAPDESSLSANATAGVDTDNTPTPTAKAAAPSRTPLLNIGNPVVERRRS